MLGFGHDSMSSMLFEEEDGSPKMRMVWSRAVKAYRVQKVYEPKTYVFRQALLNDILDAAKRPSSAVQVPNKVRRIVCSICSNLQLRFKTEDT